MRYLLALVLLVAAQNAQAPTGSISGRVVDVGTGAPVADATVSYSLDGNRTRVSVQSDNSGRFVLSNVPGGHLFITATKAGFVGGTYGQARLFGPTQWFDLAAGEKVTGIDLRLWQHASVSGRVTDQEGRPVAGAEITVHRIEVVTGRYALGIGKKARTDPDGRYLIPGLFPSSYVVSASFLASPAGGTGRIGGSGAQQTTLDYPRVFYPGSFLAGDASILELGSGDSRTNIDLAQRASVSTRVSGRVQGAPPNTFVNVELTRESNPTGVLENLSALTVTTAPDGSFSFPRVPPGRYRLSSLHVPKWKFDPETRLMMQTLGSSSWSMMGGPELAQSLPLAAVPPEPNLFAELPVDVGGEPVEKVTLTLQPAGRIVGTVSFEALATRPAGDDLQSAIVVLKRPSGRVEQYFPVARLEADGSFATSGLPPGMYSLMLQRAPARGALPPRWAFSWFAQRVTQDGKTLPEGLIEVSGSDVTVTLSMTDKPARITGTIRDSSGRPRPDASVFIVPTDRSLWTRGGSGNVLRPDRYGVYDTTVAAGDYFVVAGDGVPEFWNEVTSLDRLVRTAARVRIADAERKTQDLTVR
ncbi:MAG TPA: carboxypeptidase-like regulatory domain-containing protein [Vicinamibacterales bacterium]|nr:carboxypeptidase-like regulatory domain-containing protein [Vicinamibacterales bacterium]